MARSILLFALLTGAASADTIGFVYANGSFPNITGVPGLAAANGITAAGQIVGDAGGAGFILIGGVYTRLALPGPVLSMHTAGINNAGQVVGFYTDFITGPLVNHGFLYANGTFTTIDDPLAGSGGIGCGFCGSTFPYGINDAGEVIGYYVAAGQRFHGFLYNAGTFTTFDDPSALGGDTVAFDINNAGQFAGAYTIAGSGTTHGFVYNGSQFIDIDYPGAAQPFGTAVSGINDAGAVVGVYGDTHSTSHGFLYVNGTFTAIDYPRAANGTNVSGINNAGQIVGTAFGVPPAPEVSTGWLALPVLIGIVARRLTLRRIQ